MALLEKRGYSGVVPRCYLVDSSIYPVISGIIVRGVRMAYTYQADVWCDKCGEKIREELTAEGKAPNDPDDESSYDSGDFPKYYDAENDQSTDGPDNCASGDCGGSYELDGRRIEYGTFLENGLTQQGYEYLKQMLDDEGRELRPPLKEWADYYQFTFRGWTSPEMED